MKNNPIQVKLLVVGLSILFALPLFSCATLGTPSLPKPHSDGDTLLIVPLGRTADSDGRSFGNLRLSYVARPSANSDSSDDDFFDTGPQVRSTKLYSKYPMFGIVRYLKPGSYTIEAVRFVSEEHRHRGKRHNLKNIEFTVEPKTITVMPYRFVIYYTKPNVQYKSEDLYIYVVEADVADIEKMNEQEIGLIWEELSTYKNIELWEKR